MERYKSLVFPALYGKPYHTNWYCVAWIVAWVRSWFYPEARIIDTKTGKHYVLGE